MEIEQIIVESKLIWLNERVCDNHENWEMRVVFPPTAALWLEGWLTTAALDTRSLMPTGTPSSWLHSTTSQDWDHLTLPVEREYA